MSYVRTLDDDCIALGITGAEVMQLRLEQSWIRSWASRHGEGEKHLRAWLDAERPIVDRSLVDVAGDPQIASVVRNVIGLVPDAVAWRLVAGKVQIRCGREHCENIPDGCVGFVDCYRDPLYVGVLNTDEATVAHELGHAWGTQPSPAFVGFDPAQVSHALLADCSDAQIDQLVESRMIDEHAADRLATLWLGYTVDTTSQHRGARRREGLRQAARAHRTGTGEGGHA